MEPMRMVQVLRAACCIAGADGEIAEKERRILQALAKRVGVGSASLEAMMEQAVEDKDFYEDQFRVLKGEPNETMKLLFQIAIVDGRLGRDERGVLKQLARRLDIPDASFDDWLAKVIAAVQAKGKRSDPPGDSPAVTTS